MKSKLFLFILIIIITLGCNENPEVDKNSYLRPKIEGTWKLIGYSAKIADKHIEVEIDDDSNYMETKTFYYNSTGLEHITVKNETIVNRFTWNTIDSALIIMYDNKPVIVRHNVIDVVWDFMELEEESQGNEYKYRIYSKQQHDTEVC